MPTIIKPGVHHHRIEVRRDKRRARPTMTQRGGNYHGDLGYRKPGEDKGGSWKYWWQFGCGRLPDGAAYCPPGHKYFSERNLRGARARSKVLGRRKDRRAFKRFDVDE